MMSRKTLLRNVAGFFVSAKELKECSFKFFKLLVSIAFALIFIAVLQIFTSGGRYVRACSKAEVLPQPDGSIV